MAGFHAASEYIKLGFLLLLGGGALLFIAFFSPYWTTRSDGHAGLWQGCMDGVCYDRWNLWVTPWVKACQAFSVLSMVCTGSALVLIFLYIYHKHFELDRRMVFLSTILTFMTAFFLFLTWMIWATATYYGSGETLSWCFAFIIMSDLALIACAVCFLKEMMLPFTDYSQKLMDI